MQKLLFAALLAVAVPAAAEASVPDIDPAMWVVEDQDTTVYLFGTFHMLDGKRDWFNGAVKGAFDKSDELVLEALFPESQAAARPLVAKYAIDPQGRTLSQKLTPEIKAKLAQGLGEVGIPAKAFDPIEPWYVSLSLAALGAQKLGLKPEFGAETVLTVAARQQGKPIGELEGMERQLALLDTLSEEAQVKAIDQSIDQMDRPGETFIPMLAAWSAGDTEGLVTLLDQDAEQNREYYELLFTKRNADWADWLQARLDRPGTVFVAVGAGHLVGPNSVQRMLEARGIRTARVQ